ncbi:hypothetical protein C1H46_001211 [Malus baccata]|uniref:D-aminoacyl-tRNA deacylase n=1 Tax=Malus baccata TaxID=106549 RepID=A0A540NQ12_MALBA|nr:hypothetical protein C1H46_001211 [Malus baccata]
MESDLLSLRIGLDWKAARMSTGRGKDAAQVMALLVWEGLGLGGGAVVGNWNGEEDKNKVLLGLGGGHYAPRHMDIVLLMHNLLTVN